LKKTGSKLVSQPIKGTIKRDPDPVIDEKSKIQLFQDPKERSENVMIVDLVRNDLSKTSQRGSVKVDELFGIYSFPKVHQMTSTISSEVEVGTPFTEIIKTCFPMGSMTGAPKIRAMQLIEEYDENTRGIFSGTVGYVSPEGDFDFNVVIRSLMYDSHTHYLSFITGSAITINSDPEKEHEECLLKAASIFEALGHPELEETD
jgi:para-aminobenzoate synthetase component I